MTCLRKVNPCDQVLLAVAGGEGDLALLLRHPLDDRGDLVLQPLDLANLGDGVVLPLVLEAEAEPVGADLELLRAHHLDLQLLHLAGGGLVLDLLVRLGIERLEAQLPLRVGLVVVHQIAHVAAGVGQLGRQILGDVGLDRQVVGQGADDLLRGAGERVDVVLRQIEAARTRRVADQVDRHHRADRRAARSRWRSRPTGACADSSPGLAPGSLSSWLPWLPPPP